MAENKMTYFYTYLHRRADTNEVFYIGKGRQPGRANATNKRSNWWKAIVAKAGGRMVQILAHWPTEAAAFEHERFLIAYHRATGSPLCNMTDGGDGVSGCVPSAETRAKISAANTGRSLSAEHCAKLSVVHTGRKRGPLSTETRAKIGVASAGRVHSVGTRAKIGAASAGRSVGAETRAKISAGNCGKTVSAQTRAKIGAARAGMKGALLSVEHRAKLSAAATAWWVEKRAQRAVAAE